MFSRRPSHQAFLGAAALLFAAGVLGTIASWLSMSQMDGMPMPGGWMLSMVWMRMPRQTWPELAAAFLGMWVPMMVAMMLPSLLPALSRYRNAACSRSPAHLGVLTAVVSVAYFLVWALLGLAVYPVGAGLAAAEIQWPSLARAAPWMVGLVVLAAGVLQLTPWKVTRIACCQESPAGSRARPGIATAWRHGLTLGLRCSSCCGNVMLVVLMSGVMSLETMILATAAITAERLAPPAGYMPKVVGAGLLGAGSLLMAQAAGLT
jgi:predicted metal-binding membrane protein